MSNDPFDLFGDVEKSVGIPVVRMKFIGVEFMTYDELFSGFDTLKVITFSSSVSFINEIVEKFSDVEILLGCEGISKSVETIAAFQENTTSLLDELCKNCKNIEQMLIDKKLRFYMARDKISHEKLFLLSNTNNDNTRVITGSANLSKQAFSGKQNEVRIRCENDTAGYNYFLSLYNNFKAACDYYTRQVGKAVKADTIEKIPLWDHIKAQKVIVIENEKDTSQDIEFILNTKQRAKEIKDSLPAGIVKNDKAIIDAKSLKTIIQNVKNAKTPDTNTKFIENPAFTYNLEDCSASLNNVPWDLHPISNDIKNDCELLLKFFNGLDRIYGNSDNVKRTYYKFMIWFLCSPFMPLVRKQLQMAQRDLEKNFPVMALLAGNSTVGKTTFIKLLYSMTFGKEYYKIASKEMLNKDGIILLRNSIKGVPVTFDDISAINFSKSIAPYIKDDDDNGVKNTQYPPIIMTSNMDTLDQAYRRRIVYCKIDTAQFSAMDSHKEHSEISIKNSISNAFYKEYLRLLMEVLPNRMEDIFHTDKNVFDIFNESSKIFISILKKYVTLPSYPSYMEELSQKNYFDENYTCDAIKERFKNIFINFPENVSLSEDKKNILIRFSDKYDANIKKLIVELPPQLLCKVENQTVIMDLNAAQSFFCFKVKHVIRFTNKYKKDFKIVFNTN